MIRFALLAAVIFVAQVSQAANVTAYMTIKGQKQGQFKGESLVGVHKGSIPILGLDYQVLSPRDAATGQASGKRQHKPIVIRKEWGASTPQLFLALTNNEVLTSVKIDFYQPSPDGREVLLYTIELTNASLADVRATAQVAPNSSSLALTEAQEFSLVFQKILITDPQSGTAAADDWVTVN